MLVASVGSALAVDLGLTPKAVADDAPKERRDDLEHLTVLGPVDRLPALVRLFDVERVVVAFSQDSHERALELIYGEFLLREELGETPSVEEFQRRFPKNLGDVRGMGLMQAVELVVDETVRDRTPAKELTNRIFEEARRRGLLIGKGGLEGNAFRIAPPPFKDADCM